MRLILKLLPEQSAPPNTVDRHHVQAMIYSHLMGTQYDGVHNTSSFKFFTFSNLFPGLEIREDVPKNLIISSPDEDFIETLAEKLEPVERLYLGKIPFRVQSLKMFRLKPGKAFITDTPIVVPGRFERFFTFYRDGDINYFIERLTKNALKKYGAFTGETIELNGPLFTKMVPYKRKKGWLDVYVRVHFSGHAKTIAGSLWKRLEFNIEPSTRTFYSFLLDSGLGMLNSLGFGFVNPVR
ncbi:CRISPR-associated endoribonuclease Cas6 [Thermococcus sp. MAR1]|uniref:CRISPR-associated endoribonuclease Cas6 n=1 Tax=Thermococcus sp. MAR1 TaxID=1638263 RepID=UPI00143931C2|nr:CRISPR-associated endoribonuclease Cas6 [Thermococcus sp. MAR1]NJE10062.1 CRISPR-associated endoribonuclease Cas6 [Thermococcus sp. MAR1]